MPKRLLVTLLCILLALPAAAALARDGDGPWRHLRYNLHTTETRPGEYMGAYFGMVDPKGQHVIFPYNTRVRLAETGRTLLIEAEGGKRIEFLYDPGRMRMRAEDYFDRITAPTPVAYPEFSNVDKKGVAGGRVFVGMSKQGVLTALGVPPFHQTPNPQMNRWQYWKHRYDKLVVVYGRDGRVRAVWD